MAPKDHIQSADFHEKGLEQHWEPGKEILWPKGAPKGRQNAVLRVRWAK